MSFLILKQLYRFSTNLRRHIYLECLHNFCKESFVCGHCAGSLYICIYVLVLKNVLRNSHIQYTPILVGPLILYGDFVGVHLGLWRVLILYLRLLLNCYSGPAWPAIDHTSTIAKAATDWNRNGQQHLSWSWAEGDPLLKAPSLFKGKYLFNEIEHHTYFKSATNLFRTLCECTSYSASLPFHSC